MAYENTGLLARNERKEKDTHPDFSGTLNIDGVEYWLSGWTKEGREGTKLAGKRYFSLSVKPKNPPAEKPVQKTEDLAKASGAPRFADMDDDIPF